MIDGKAETDVRIFVLSRKLSPQALLETARGHWQIENGLHWQLDVARLDQSKGSLTAKLKRAGWNDDFMLKLLSQMR